MATDTSFCAVQVDALRSCMWRNAINDTARDFRTAILQKRPTHQFDQLETAELHGAAALVHGVDTMPLPDFVPDVQEEVRRRRG